MSAFEQGTVAEDRCLVAGRVANRPQPAVGLLMVENGVDHPLDLRLQHRIVQQVRERDSSIEPVRQPLPALCLAAGPGAVLDIRPELVEMPAEPGCLDLKLLAKPTGGLDVAQGKRPEGRRCLLRMRPFLCCHAPRACELETAETSISVQTAVVRKRGCMGGILGGVWLSASVSHSIVGANAELLPGCAAGHAALRP